MSDLLLQYWGKIIKEELGIVLGTYKYTFFTYDQKKITFYVDYQLEWRPNTQYKLKVKKIDNKKYSLFDSIKEEIINLPAKEGEEKILEFKWETKKQIQELEEKYQKIEKKLDKKTKKPIIKQKKQNDFWGLLWKIFS